MFGLPRLAAWWRARRERHLQQMAASDPRAHLARQQTGEARLMREEADRMTAAASARLQEIAALRASVKATRPQ